MVYGPRSYGWTVRMLNLVEKGVPVIFGPGTGYAYPVYIDNLIDGMILAATRPEAAGEAFNMVDAPVTWREWFGYYGAMSGRKPRALPLWLARIAFAAIKWLPLGFATDRSLITYYLARTVYPTTKAERLLDYRPRIAIEEGMRHTEAWLQQVGYLSRQRRSDLHAHRS
jgi:nucleoside-diphosphate-sugar epimerase